MLINTYPRFPQFLLYFKCKLGDDSVMHLGGGGGIIFYQISKNLLHILRQTNGLILARKYLPYHLKTKTKSRIMHTHRSVSEH